MNIIIFDINLFKGGYYFNLPMLQRRLLFKGGFYSRAALIQGNICNLASTPLRKRSKGLGTLLPMTVTMTVTARNVIKYNHMVLSCD